MHRYILSYIVYSGFLEKSDSIYYTCVNTKHNNSIFCCLVFVASFIFFFFPKNLYASQTFDVCYSQCAAYKFVWNGDMCWDLFQNQCTSGSGNAFIETIKFLKDVKSLLVKGDGIETVFKAFFVCKPLIEDCIVPQLRECKQTCQIDNMVYAPDLSVGHPDSSLHGVIYDEKDKQLYFKVVDNGLGYAWDIDVEATYGHTKNRDAVIQNSQQLFKEKIEHLIYLGARNGPPKTLTDYVSDFLIDEAKQGQFFQGFKSWLLSDKKSDSKDYNVPNYWMKGVPFTPVVGELNRIILTVDSGNKIDERSKLNNTFTLDIDLRPTPARFEITKLSNTRDKQTLNSFLTSFQIKNNGEESGNARIVIYEVNYQSGHESGRNQVYQSDQIVMGKSVFNVDTTINIDAKQEKDPYCGKLKKYQIVVTDEDNNKTTRDIWLPIYTGSVSGRVENLFGKKIVGAKIHASTGEETVVNDKGYYHLKNLTTYGTITITAGHQNYSQEESKEITLQIKNELKPCVEGELAFNSVNFVLKDKPVKWTVWFKDTNGKLLEGSVLASNPLFRIYEQVNGQYVKGEMQPGEYDVTVRVQGYYPIFKKITLTPPEAESEFIFEKIGGRENDDGLRLITPKLLWKKQLGPGNGLIGNLTASKNGKLLAIYVANNKTKKASLFFIDPLSGKIIKENPVAYTISQQRNIGLDASYDARTVGLFLNPEVPGKTDKARILTLFNAQGNRIGETAMSEKSSIFLDVSPDGFYLYPNALVNSSFHKYTRKEVEGIGDGRDLQGYGSYINFLNNGNLISICKDRTTGSCERTISDTQVKKIADLDGVPRVIDETFDGSTLIIRSDKKIYSFGAHTWAHESRRDSGFVSASISPGGMYTLVAEGNGSNTLLTLKIYGNTGGDKTTQFLYKDVRFVSANDKGLFFAQVISDKIEYYQVGVYQKDYNASNTFVTQTKESNFVTGIFQNIGDFFGKIFGSIFKKKQ